MYNRSSADKALADGVVDSVFAVSQLVHRIVISLAELPDIIYDAPLALLRLARMLALGIAKDVASVNLLCEDMSDLGGLAPLKLVLYTFKFIGELAGHEAMIEQFCSLPRTLLDCVPAGVDASARQNDLDELLARSEFEV